MRAKLIPIVIALTVCGAVAMTSNAMAGGRAETKVTIDPGSGGGEYFGLVKSPKPQRCANGRKVTLFKVKPGKDEKVGTDIAQPNGDGYQWNTGSTGVHHGKVYAHVGRIPGCLPDNSRLFQAS